MAEDYLCVTVLSRNEELEGAFKTRLSECWTYMLRNHEEDFEKVYAETVGFERIANRLSRKYLVEAEVQPLLESLFAAQGIDHEPIDPDDVYSKYEAVPPDWMWIEH